MLDKLPGNCKMRGKVEKFKAIALKIEIDKHFVQVFLASISHFPDQLLEKTGDAITAWYPFHFPNLKFHPWKF